MPSSIYNIDSSTESIDTGFENSHSIVIEENDETSSLKSLISHQELIEVNHPLDKENPLNAVIKFHLDGEGHSSLTRELRKQTGLFAVAICGVIFYYVPSKAYAESICADPAYKAIPCDFLLINHIAGTMLVAGGVLISATNAFFDQKNAESIPVKLERYLQYPYTPAQKLAENTVTYLGSFVASIPFIIITVVDPIPGLPKLIVTSQAFMVGVTNTLLHLLPFKLVLKNPLYRLPFLPIEFIIKTIANARLSKEEKQEKTLQQSVNLGYQLIKHRLIAHLDQAQRLLSIYGFKFKGCHYDNEVARYIQENQASESSLQLLTQLLDRLHAMSPNRPIPASGRINNFFRKMVYIPGASWVILACAGFWGGTINEMIELTGNPVSGAIVATPSVYCLGVLLAFFGGNALQNSYDYLTAWKDDTVKIALSFKPYPKTAVLLIMISMYLSAFSYSAGAQLINDNFKGELEIFRDCLLELAKSGLIFLGFTAMVDFFKNVLIKFAQYAGTEDAQTAAKLFAAFNQMQNSIQLMKPDLLLESLANATEDQLKSLLAIQDNNDLQDFCVSLMQLAEHLKNQLFKEFEVIDNVTRNEVLIKLENDLKNDYAYKINTIKVLLSYFDSKPELTINLSLNWQRICQEYKSICKIIEKLDKLSLKLVKDHQLDTYSRYSINNDDSMAGPSSGFSEVTPLILPRRSPSYAHFWRPRYGTEEVRASLSPLPTFSNSNQMGV